MIAEVRTERWSWVATIVVLAACEAMATAAWLLPASVHIVQWPEEGPARLALLAPAWQLMVWLAAGLAVAGAVVWRAHWAVRSRLPAALPLNLLWLWIVPYVPWLPDRLPLLLVLAGPVRWAIAGVAVVMAVRGAGHGSVRACSAALSRRAIFALSLAIYLGLGLYSARSIGVGGDEPHYLIITESLLKDGDLQIENNHQRRDYRSFFPGDLRPDFFERGKNGQIYSIHAPGLPALLLPAYAVAGRLGAVALIALLAALTALAVFDLADALAGRGAAVVAWAASCLTVPFVPYAWLIFPELPGALLVAWSALWVWQSRHRTVSSTTAPTTDRTADRTSYRTADPAQGRMEDRPPLTWFVRGLALATLPWLHTKFSVFLAIFASALGLRLLRRPRALGALALPIAVSGALWMYSFYAIYGAFNPEAPYGDYSRIYVLTKYIPHGLVGIFFDQKFGLLFYSPIYLASIAGAWLMLKRPESRFLGGVLLLVLAAFVGSTARLYMFWGGSSAPARFLVPVLPCLAPMIALAVSEARSAAARSLLGLAIAVSLVLSVVGIVAPDRLMLFSDPHGRARILELLQAGSPLSLVVPTFTEPTWARELGRLVAWLGAAALACASVVVGTRWGGLRAWGGAVLGCLVLLLAGAVVTATATPDVRSATARRGAIDVLWRYDGDRFRTLDYQTMSRATPDRLLALTTFTLAPASAATTSAGASAITVPVSLPAGAYEAVVRFADSTTHDGEIQIADSPRAVFGRASGSLASPARIPFDAPVATRRLAVNVSDRAIAAAISSVEIVPRAVVPPPLREAVPVRLVEALEGRPGAYIGYTDEHAYPEGGVFWSRGTAQTQILVAPFGATRMTLTLSTGPRSGIVRISVGGEARTVEMVAGRESAIAFELAQGARLVSVTVESTVMFRPAEVDANSTDSRGLGCQVRVTLE